jgi:hypothetical protein
MVSRRENEKPFSSGENRTENPPAGTFYVDHVAKRMSKADLETEQRILFARLFLCFLEREGANPRPS